MGPRRGQGAREIRGVQDNVLRVLTDQAEWLPDTAERIPGVIPNWVTVRSRWTEGELQGGGDA